MEIDIKYQYKWIGCYHHFIIDFLWPLYELLDKLNQLNKPTNIQLLHGYVGLMRWYKFIECVFPLVEINQKKRNGKKNNLYYIDAKTPWKMNMKAEQPSFLNFKNYILNKLKINCANADTLVLVKRAKKRCIINHKDLVKILKKINMPFKVVLFEKMTLKEQIEICFKANILIGRHGAGLTNLLWMQPSSMIIELKSFFEKPQSQYECMANLLNVNYKRATGRPIRPNNYLQKYRFYLNFPKEIDIFVNSKEIARFFYKCYI